MITLVSLQQPHAAMMITSSWSLHISLLHWTHIMLHVSSLLQHLYSPSASNIRGCFILQEFRGMRAKHDKQDNNPNHTLLNDNSRFDSRTVVDLLCWCSGNAACWLDIRFNNGPGAYLHTAESQHQISHDSRNSVQSISWKALHSDLLSGSGFYCEIDLFMVVKLSISENKSMADICLAAKNQYVIPGMTRATAG